MVMGATRRLIGRDQPAGGTRLAPICSTGGSLRHGTSFEPVLRRAIVAWAGGFGGPCHASRGYAQLPSTGKPCVGPA